MPQRPNPNIFANNPLDRAAERRLEPDWLAARLEDPSTLMIPFWRSLPFMVPGRGDGAAPEVGWLRPGALGDVVDASVSPIFLGLENDISYFALNLRPELDMEHDGPLADLGQFMELRETAGDIPPSEAAILAQAKSLLDWHQRHRYCSNCGAPTETADAGYKRACPECGADHFPRTDPVVIVLPIRGDEVLMGRSPGWPDRFYSALAGFVEPGETIAEAARREVKEETDVDIDGIRIFSSQPWPYPSSLMIGCFAEAKSTEIKIDEVEIEDARWFTVADIEAAIREEPDAPLLLPPRIAIAHQLIKHWLAER
jgi:NAD+ diphosphatase